MGYGFKRMLAPWLSSNTNGEAIHFSGALVQNTIAKELSNKTNTNFTFPVEFPNECIAAIPFNFQTGFGTPITISIGNITKTGCTCCQSNDLNVSCQIRVFAIGY